jgi:hypothetical protein
LESVKVIDNQSIFSSKEFIAMSNKLEILKEYQEAASKLDQLKSKEAAVCRSQQNAGDGTVVIKPQFGNEMNQLNEKCVQLNMILEAMDVAED